LSVLFSTQKSRPASPEDVGAFPDSLLQRKHFYQGMLWIFQA